MTAGVDGAASIVPRGESPTSGRTGPRDQPGHRRDRRDQPGATATSLWTAMRQLFRGQYLQMSIVSLMSFLGGLAEAALLVLIANLALTIAGQSEKASPAGVFGFASSSTRSLFLAALALTGVRLVFQYVAAWVMARTIAELTQQIRSGTFDDYIHASWELQASVPEADVQDLLIRHVARVQSALVTTSVLLSNMFMVLALVGSTFLVDPVSAALIILVGVVLFYLLRPLTIRAKLLARQQIRGGLVYNEQSREAIDLSLEIRAFGVSDAIAERLDRATSNEVAPMYRSQLISRMLPATYGSAAVLILLLALLGLDTFLSRPLASIGAIVIILVRALNQTSGIQSAFHSLSEFVPFIDRLESERRWFRSSTPPSGSETPPSIGSIRFEGVGYSYDHENAALDDISFSVEPGEAVGIIGPSGSGKSTLIQILLRLRHPQSGRYLIGGLDAEDVSDRRWFEMISFVPQDCRVYDASIADNIRFFRAGVTDDQVILAARRAHVHDEIMAMPDGYDSILGSRGGALSGGQRQRIAIARALVNTPSMLVLDEPTSALDMRSESLVHETLESLKTSMTLFIIAHRLSTLNTCDRLMVLRGGRLQAFGDREDLQRENEFYREALRLSHIKER